MARKKIMQADVAGELLKSFVERIERLTEEKKALSQDISQVFSEAKGQGFDTKALREIIWRRAQTKAALDEFLALVDAYERALGDFVNTDLGKAANPGHADLRGADH